jgi:hypothetical protein
MSIDRVKETKEANEAGEHGRLAHGYRAEILSLANNSPDEIAAAARHGRLAPDYPPEAPEAKADAPPAASTPSPGSAHGRLGAGYQQAVAEFLADR